MKRKRILTVLIVLALVFIWGNSLVSRELSGKISDDILFFLNAAAEKVGLGPDAFTYMTDEDGDGVARAADEPSHPQGGARHGVCSACGASVPPAGERREKAVFHLRGLGTLTGAIDETLQIFSHRGSQVRDGAHRQRRRAAGSRRRNVDFIFNQQKREVKLTSLFLCAGAGIQARRERPAELVDEPASDGFLAVEHAADVLRQLAGAHHILGESLRRDVGMAGDEPDDPIADARNIIVRLRHAITTPVSRTGGSSRRRSAR